MPHAVVFAQTAIGEKNGHDASHLDLDNASSASRRPKISEAGDASSGYYVRDPLLCSAAIGGAGAEG